MFNDTLPSYPSVPAAAPPAERAIATELNAESVTGLNENPSQSLNAWWILGGAVFLVSVPVFVQAPLVRLLPGLSLLLSLGWLGLSFRLLARPATALWGDLLMGFTWSWFAGSIYWGWLRWEPLFHIPIEAIGLPCVIYLTLRRWGMIGNYFYMGSLFGTAITDFYFYMVNLIPHWRQLMQVDPDLALPIFQSAIADVKTLWGISWVIVLTAILLAVGIFPLRSRNLHWWAFSGAVLGTILVDSLFWLAASSV